MKIFLFVFSVFIYVSSANAQKAYDCGGQQAYDLAKDIVTRTLEGASNLSVVDEGVEQTTMHMGEGGQANVEKWKVLVTYDQNGTSGWGQSFEITYVVSIDPTTLQATCRFRSAVETWTE